MPLFLRMGVTDVTGWVELGVNIRDVATTKSSGRFGPPGWGLWRCAKTLDAQLSRELHHGWSDL